eukprot:749032-Hanusia_phi.AAC.3
MCELSSTGGQKTLVVNSMVSLQNFSTTSIAAAVSDGADLYELGCLKPNDVMSVPAKFVKSGILFFKPVNEDCEYQWCNEMSEAVNLKAIQDGTFRLFQMVDTRFQKLFGSQLMPETSLLNWYACANDVEGFGLRQGVLYLTDNCLCHYSNIMGLEQKVMILFSDIVEIQKCYTAFVFPNAIKVRTSKKTWYFRTFRNRAETFRSIVKVMPNQSVAKSEDDVDEKARAAFSLDEADVILSMYSCQMHRDPHIIEGYALITTFHLLFMNYGASKLVKLPWKEISAIEKRKSFLIRNNAIYASTASQSLFISSGKWDRDKVVDEEMTPLWRSAVGDSSCSLSDSNAPSKTVLRNRTLTCRMMSKTQEESKLADYQRKIARSREVISFSVCVLDALTMKNGFERTVGNPLTIQFHSPWTVENLTQANLEIQLIDPIAEVIAHYQISSGSNIHVCCYDFRRNINGRIRLKTGDDAIETNWSKVFEIYHCENWENELSVSIPDLDEKSSQDIRVEVSRDSSSSQVRICLYNRFWLMNLTGLKLTCQKFTGLDVTSRRELDNGALVAYDGDLEFRLSGFAWSSAVNVLDSNQRRQVVCLNTATDEHPFAREKQAIDNETVNLHSCMIPASGKFDRTALVLLLPAIFVQNDLNRSIVLWQRGTECVSFDRLKMPHVLVGPNTRRPFHPEGARELCRLSVSQSEHIHRLIHSTIFSPAMEEVTLLRTEENEIVSAKAEVSVHGPIIITFSEVSSRIPHRLVNNTPYTLEFLQVGSSVNETVSTEPYQVLLPSSSQTSAERFAGQTSHLAGPFCRPSSTCPVSH